MNWLYKIFGKGNKKIVAEPEKTCPPKTGGCPMMFYCIPNGETRVCPACDKLCKGSMIMF